MPTPHVLILRNDSAFCSSISALFQKLGFVVVPAATVKEAREHCAKTRMAVIVLTCDEEHLQFVEHVRQKELYRHPLVLGILDGAPENLSIGSGIDDFVEVPKSLDELKKILKRWGYLRINSSEELKQVQDSLRKRRQELQLQFQGLQKQKRKLDGQLLNLERQNKLLKEQRNEVATSIGVLTKTQLLEWQAVLERREWSLHTRERFLTSRQTKACIDVTEKHQIKGPGP